MTKSKTDKHLTLSYKKTISKSDLHPLKVVGNKASWMHTMHRTCDIGHAQPPTTISPHSLHHFLPQFSHGIDTARIS